MLFHRGEFIILQKLLDVILVLLSGFLAFWLKGVLTLYFEQYCIALIVMAIFSHLLFMWSGNYNFHHTTSILKQMKRVTTAWILFVSLFLLITFFSKISASFSRVWFVELVIIGYFLTAISRVFIHLILKVRLLNSAARRSVLIIGDFKQIKRTISAYNKYQEGNYAIKYILVDTDKANIPEGLGGYSVEKFDPNNLVENVVKSVTVDEVWVCYSMSQQVQIKIAMKYLRFMTFDVRLFSEMDFLNTINFSVSEINGLTSFDIRRSPMSGIQYILKSLGDFCFSFIAIVLLSPILLILAILVKLSSKGPVFYKQERVSWNGKSFNMLKFRSMPLEAEQKTGAVWAKAGENRATKVGAFMRKTSLDELPQFINVLKGDMSIVGPRPERPVFVDKFKKEIPGYMQKHMVKAGITGWAQIHGWRGDTDLNKRIEYDLYYIDNWSFLLDFKIIVFTVLKGFRDKNAY